MFLTTRKPYLAKDTREITISETSNLPQLYRFSSQYDFAVVGINEGSATPKKYRLIEIKQSLGIVGSSQTVIDITTNFNSLKSLEEYTTAHLIEIIQHYFDSKLIPSSIEKSNNNVA
jgi:hypothetical protein